MYPPSIQKLIDQFSKFPTIGPRTAARFVFYLIKLPRSEAEKLIGSISDVREKITFCSFCFNTFEETNSDSKEKLCSICSHPSRDKSLLCVVEKETDLLSLEKTKKYKGIYFILGGTVSTLKKEDIKKLRTKELIERIKNTSSFKEIILAINSTTEGIATDLYLERILRPLKIKITRLGRGLPVGGELEYADDETLSSAIENRRENS